MESSEPGTALSTGIRGGSPWSNGASPKYQSPR